MNSNRILALSLICFIVLLSSCNKPYLETAYGFKTEIDSTVVEVQFYSPELLRVIKSRSGVAFEKQSFAVVKAPQEVSFSISNNEHAIVASTDKLNVILNRTTGVITYTSSDGSALVKEQNTADLFTPKEDVGLSSFSVKQSFTLDAEEYIYGLGQYQEGKMSQRNQTLKMVQENHETVVPFILSNKHYGIYWDNYSPTVFSDNTEVTSFASEIGDCIDYYFMVGENADGVIANMRDLTGQAPMMPYWTYGFWQSKERYKSQDETVAVVKRYRDMGVPIDGIIQDWQYWGDNFHWNAMAFLNPQFPNPKKMIDEIHELNAHIIISCWASFGPQTKQFDVLQKNDMLMDFKTWPLSSEDVWPPDPNKPSGVKVYDAFNPEARNIYWDFMNKGLFQLGIDGWWLDSSEPDHMDKQEDDLDNKTFSGSFRKVRNAFPIAHVGGVASHQKETSKDKRVFILTRSAYAGQQRYGAVSWSGDVMTDWGVLRKQISAGLNFSLTGIPYWNSDIGGFFVWDYPGGYKNKAFHEIYVRWMQFGAFCPMMRSHGTDTPRELWYYGEEGDWAYDALKKMIELRYSLLPYIYSNSWDVTANGSSMMRALVMDFANDRKALDIDNQYMFGKNILVCPVTEPMYVKVRTEGKKHYSEGADFSKVKTSEVYLPAGTKWIDFWSGRVFDGGQKILRETPIDILPLFVKAGSIIPLGPEVQYANEKIGPLTIRIYSGADATFTFYDDERDNYNYEDGSYATIEMKWDDTLQKITIEAQKGTYEGIPLSRQLSFVLVDNSNGIGLPKDDMVTKEITYSGTEVEIQM